MKLWKKGISGLLLSLLLISTVTLTFIIQPVKARAQPVRASGTIYIRGADGSIDPLCFQDVETYSMILSTPVSGYISTNTTWTLADSPYMVVGDVVVEPDVFLTIEAGVVVKFTSGTNLIIDGALLAQGNSTYTITFTSNATTPQVGDWGSIRFRATSIDDACIMDWVIIEYAETGIIGDSRSPRIANSIIRFNTVGVENVPRIFNSTVRRNDYGIKNSAVIWDSVVANNTCGMYALYISRLDVNRSTFSGNRYGIQESAVSSVSIYGSTFSGNEYGVWAACAYNYHYINIYGTTFSGNEYGIYMYVNRPMRIYESTFTDNKNAISSSGWESITLTGSNVSDNNFGISASKGTTAIFHSTISDNNGTGIDSGSLSVMYSTISGNQQNGIISRGGSVHFSNVYNNTPYDVCNNALYGTDVNATNNWWGTTNETLIRELIYDYYDDYNLGRVLYKPYLTRPPTYDVAVMNVIPSKTVVGQGYSMNITVTVQNQGDFEESFNVSVFYDDTVITLPDGKNHTTTTLPSGNSTNLTIPWNTTGVPYGNYTMTAKATQLLGEIDTLDNEYVDGWVVVTIPGDITGEYKVDHKDLLLLASAYGSEVGDPNYIPEADIDGSGKVDHKDLLILAANYGKET